jgi:hypothetical protein
MEATGVKRSTEGVSGWQVSSARPGSVAVRHEAAGDENGTSEDTD